MSSTVRSYGFIAVLNSPISADDREELHERLWQQEGYIGTNYDGTLVFCDFNRNKSRSERENVYGLFIGQQDMDRDALPRECHKCGLPMELETMKPYNCIWYNGGDCPLYSLTKEEFLKI
jgi:hypothetical protein